MDKPPKTSAQESPRDDETPKPKLELVPPTEEELDEEEKEFRALRRDLPGVKGARGGERDRVGAHQGAVGQIETSCGFGLVRPGSDLGGRAGIPCRRRCRHSVQESA